MEPPRRLRVSFANVARSPAIPGVGQACAGRHLVRARVISSPREAFREHVMVIVPLRDVVDYGKCALSSSFFDAVPKRVRTSIVRSAVEFNLHARMEALTKGLE